MKREESKSGLPSGYKRLEYIEATGTQWIDTGIECGKDLEVCCVKRYTRADINDNADGVQFWDSNNIIIRLNYHTDTGLFCYYGDNDKTIKVRTDIEDFLGWHTYDFKNKSQIIDGIEYAKNEMTVDTKKTYYIGKVNSPGTYISYAQYKEYAFHKFGKCIMRLVPALRLSDNKPGMYNIVNDVFYTNAGTGEFLYK